MKLNFHIQTVEYKWSKNMDKVTKGCFFSGRPSTLGAEGSYVDHNMP